MNSSEIYFENFVIYLPNLREGLKHIFTADIYIYIYIYIHKHGTLLFFGANYTAYGTLRVIKIIVFS